MDSAIISFQNLEKRFAKVAALQGVNLQIRQGEIFCLLGLNGAGKTTLLRCLLGLIRASCGDIFFQGRPLKNNDIQRNFGFLPENFQPYGNLTGKEFLRILAWGLSVDSAQVDSLFEQAGLSEQKNKYIKAYSRGMIQRLGMVIALLKNPEVIILDEPTLGLDPLGQSQILGFLEDLNQKGKTVFFSSHILSQVERVCHRIGIIHCGKIVFVGTTEEILRKHSCVSLEEAFLREVKAITG
jgi:ABC-type multidrug transport system ATPase subunit